MTIFISHGDFVVVQEGQQDLPIIIILEEVAVTESASLSLGAESTLASSVFESVLAQDASIVAPSVAIVVQDDVGAREGQSDNELIILLNDSITLTESVALLLFPILLSINEALGVVDAPSLVFDPAEATLVITLDDDVVVQDIVLATESMAMSVFDLVIVIDGPGPSIEASDAIALEESATVFLPFLTLVLVDSLTIAESTQVFLVRPDVVVQDELLVNEFSTILLPVLPASVSESIVASENVTVTVTPSLALVPNVSDAVTAAEAITIYTTPIEIIEFTEAVLVTETVTILLPILLVDVGEAVLISDEVTVAMNLLLLDVSDDVRVRERIGKGRRGRGLLMIGVGK